jgi:large-conductance mechanosensitive channel
MMFFPWIPIIMMVIPFLIFAFVVWLIIKAVTLPFKGGREEAQSVNPRFEALRAEVDSLKKDVEELKDLTAELVILMHDLEVKG